MKKMKRYAEGDMIEGDASVAEQMEKAPAKAAPKNRVVTKEELEASGLSLRDFLNKERGLTRRGESAPKTESITKTTVKTEAPAPKSPEPAKAEKSGRGVGPYGVFAGPSDEEKAATYAKYEENRKKMGASMPKGGSSDIAESDWAKSVRSSQAAADSGESLGRRFRKALGSSYAKGGSVSSASRRADGIAQRGKTRGKMC